LAKDQGVSFAQIMKIRVEIADTALTLAKGLMDRKAMASDEGMLFKFPYITEGRFWGKDTYIPLDIAFINGNTIVDINYITPMSTKAVVSKQLCTSAIEVNAGFFTKNNIGVGSIISVQGNEIEFEGP